MCFFLLSRMAAVGDGLVERLEAFERVGPVLRRVPQVLEQTAVGGAPVFRVVLAELLSEVLPDQGVGVETTVVALREELTIDEGGKHEVPLLFLQL